MKYFAMIGGRQQGPFGLDELHDAGVTPDTYVWCKEMDDWQPAAEVADICRYWRQRLAGTLPGQNRHEDVPSSSGDDSAGGPENPAGSRFINRFGVPDLPPADSLFEPDDPSVPPKTMLVPAVIATLACCPVTGFMAIYYAVLTRRCWTASQGGMKEGAPDPGEMRRQAYEASRNAKMWTGITFFLGLILWAFLISFAS